MKYLLAIALLMSTLCGNLLAQTVSVRADHEQAETVFAEIMRQTGRNFVYPAGLLRGLKVSVDASRENLTDLLDRMFAHTGIAYKIKGNNVILFRRPAVPRKSEPPVTVSGFIRESGSKEPLAGALVRDSISGASVVANVNGFYSLAVVAGDIRLQIICPGYETFTTSDLEVRSDRTMNFSLGMTRELDEVEVVGSRNNAMATESPHVGRYILSRQVIAATPAILGESDVTKTLQLQPGVSSGLGGMAGMHVHGGNVDENMYMLDNIPLYQINHFGGMFSAFNTEAMRSVEFYKSSFPAKYDGRLSSYMDVHTRDGSLARHHGSLKLGLTTAAFNIDGPLQRGRTSYSFAVRRTWQDLIAKAVLAVADDDDESTDFGYSFLDVNAKINHHFSERSNAHIMFYYGYDRLHGGSDSRISIGENTWTDTDRQRLRWGNIVLSAGWNYVLSPKLFGEFTAAYTRYASRMTADYDYGEFQHQADISRTRNKIDADNNISDWIVRADMDWNPSNRCKVNFGIGYTRHSFLPSRATRSLVTDIFETEVVDSAWTYRANELNGYIGADWVLTDRLRFDGGLHLSLFAIDRKTHYGISPRLSARYKLSGSWALKVAYARTTQYVHQLAQSYLALPTDQWVPVTGAFKPQSADQISMGIYKTWAGKFTFSAEGYYKWMHNLIEYRDEYYLISPKQTWDARLTSGSGRSRGIDLKLTKDTGRLTGHISWSLLWADRTFALRNGGKTYPARFDNRHKINIVMYWRASSKWEINASWIGMTGNRMTLPVQMWSGPGFGGSSVETPLRTSVNNYRLPFYHRLDLGFIRHTKHGQWTFSLYNAYCNMNTVTVQRATSSYPGWRPVFQQLRLLPVIPTISYTWIF